ncbi:MAG: SpoIIE family protein phosphatase, partial [bacterium]|nr:SpoIIE family protein phosphatase [bacterium]
MAREKRLSSLVRVRTKALEESYRIIEVKNRNIISSIEYAGRIQQAMLPGHERIRDLLADCFILFKPRDIVSGDFYWFYRKAHLLFIAVVDCTGHGVPGALLSMIGKIKLDEIVAEGTIHDPVSLLENLHTRVRGELHQEVEGNKTNDGMDVAMCMVDSKERKLFFTGAKRPLYYYGDSQLK